MHTIAIAVRRAWLALCPVVLCLEAALAQTQEPPGDGPAAQAMPSAGVAPDDGPRGGRYGAVRMETEDAALQPAASRWIRDLHPGEPIDEKALQRRLQLLGQLPGVNSKSVLGAADDGVRDLSVTLTRKPRYSGLIGLDNHGSRFTGDQRLRFALDLPSLWTLGDSLSLQGQRRWHGTWNLVVGYSLPLGVDGWSLRAELDHTDYQLHRERRGLNARGTVDILLLELSYPLWLGEAGNVQASVGLERTHSDDTASPRGKAPLQEHRTLNMLPLKLSGQYTSDKARTSGELTLGLGRLKLDHGMRNEDRTSARTEGHYRLLSADLRHEQTLRKDWGAVGPIRGPESQPQPRQRKVVCGIRAATHSRLAQRRRPGR